MKPKCVVCGERITEAKSDDPRFVAYTSEGWAVWTCRPECREDYEAAKPVPTGLHGGSEGGVR